MGESKQKQKEKRRKGKQRVKRKEIGLPMMATLAAVGLVHTCSVDARVVGSPSNV